MRYVKKFDLIKLIILLSLSLILKAEGIVVDPSSVIVNYQKNILEARFKVQLNPTLEEALKHGIPLSFTLTCDVVQARWYWFEKKIYSSEQNRKITYNPLTREYRLYIGSVYVSFNSLEDVLQAVGQIINWKLSEQNLLKKGETYNAVLQLKLDVSQLPKPFQIDALANNDWNLASNSYHWMLAP